MLNLIDILNQPNLSSNNFNDQIKIYKSPLTYILNKDKEFIENKIIKPNNETNGHFGKNIYCSNYQLTKSLEQNYFIDKSISCSKIIKKNKYPKCNNNCLLNAIKKNKNFLY